MAKTGDFGGLPNDVFKSMLSTFTTGTSATDAEKIKVLGELADEEHAATNCTDFNTIEVVLKCIQIRELADSIRAGTAPAGSAGVLAIHLNNLKGFWKA